MDAALKKGDLKFTLDGDKLKGSWVLVRTRVRALRRGERSWLLIKHRDDWAGPIDIAEFAPLSVKSGGDFHEILAAGYAGDLDIAPARQGRRPPARCSRTSSEGGVREEQEDGKKKDKGQRKAKRKRKTARRERTEDVKSEEARKQLAFRALYMLLRTLPSFYSSLFAPAPPHRVRRAAGGRGARSRPARSRPRSARVRPATSPSSQRMLVLGRVARQHVGDGPAVFGSPHPPAGRWRRRSGARRRPAVKPFMPLPFGQQVGNENHRPLHLLRALRARPRRGRSASGSCRSCPGR